MKKLIIPGILLLLITVCSRTEIPEYPHYDIEVSLIPDKQYLYVNGSLKVPVDLIDGSIEFYLHKQLKIEQLFLNGREVKNISAGESDIRYMPDAKKYTVRPGIILSRTATLSYTYSGRITDWNEWSASVIGEEWTEMGLYFPWYPYSRAFTPFSYEVEVRTEGDYRTFMMGSETRDIYYAIYKTDNPTNDMVLCAAKDLKTVSKDIYRYNLRLAHTTFSDELTDTLTNDVEAIMTLYNRWFPSDELSICIVESLREKGGGYARLGGIYLPGFNETDYYEARRAYTRYLAHEISHLWWYRANANTWEDWLNEGFAEYSALMVLRELYGQAYFDEWIEKKRKDSEDTPPVWLYDRNGDRAQAVLYDKASLIIHELEKKVGRDSFGLFLWSMIRNRVSTTEEFLGLLEEKLGKEVKDWFMTMLRDY